MFSRRIGCSKAFPRCYIWWPCCELNGSHFAIFSFSVYWKRISLWSFCELSGTICTGRCTHHRPDISRLQKVRMSVVRSYCYCYWGLKVQGSDKPSSGYYKENYERIPDYHGLSTLRDAYESRFAYSNDYSSALFGASPACKPKGSK